MIHFEVISLCTFDSDSTYYVQYVDVSDRISASSMKIFCQGSLFKQKY